MKTICHCLQVKRKTLLAAIKNGADTVEKLTAATGASTGCGGCAMRLHEIVGGAQWTPVLVNKVLRVTDDVRSFRFKPLAGMDLQPALAGQHVIVQAKIGSNWVERPYTLSSACNENRYREITVKRNPDGLLSNWLFDER